MKNKTDATKNAKGQVPALRFPEFRHAPVWAEKPLGLVCDILQGYGFPEMLQGKRDGKYPFCKVSDISKAFNENGGVLDQAANYISDQELLGLRAKLIPKSSTVFAKIGEALRLNRRAITTVDCLIDNNATGLKAKDGLAHDYFIYFLSQRIDLNEYCGGAVPSVNKTTLENIIISAPLHDEQKKIAECLSSVDGLISAQARKVDALKAHKKGLMQQLFPAEGKTVPALRFPEFRHAPAWEEKPLKSICHMQAGKFVAASEINEYNDDTLFPCYGGNGLRGYTKTHTHEGYYPLIGRQGALCGNITYVNGKFHATEHAVVATPEKEIDVEWLYYKLCHLNLNQYATGQAQPGLSVDVLEKVSTIVPPKKEEQQKIAECLSSVDELIAAQARKLDVLKLHKKGLMQQLFPAAGGELTS